MTPKEAVEQMTGDDAYDKAIVYAAMQLTINQQLCEGHCYCPDYKSYVYYTQYETGTTIWRSPDGTRSVLVTLEGEVRDSLPHHP